MTPVTVRAYAGRDNEIRRELLADGVPLSPEQLQSITDVIIQVGDDCLTMTGGDIELAEGVVIARLGQVIDEGGHRAWLTVRSLDYPAGVAWEEWYVMVLRWPACQSA